MSIDFDGTGDFYSLASATLSATPVTIAAWVYPHATGANHQIYGCTDGDASDLIALHLESTDSMICNFRVAGSFAQAKSTTTISSADVWYHGIAIAASSTDRRAYLDGGGEGQNTTSKSFPSGMSATGLGARSAGSNEANARIAEVGVWNVALGAGERAALAGGVCPLRVRPGALIAYHPLFDTGYAALDLSGNGNSPTTSNGNPATADHAPCAPMFGVDMGWQGAFTEAAVGGLSIPVAMHSYRRHHQAGV